MHIQEKMKAKRYEKQKDEMYGMDIQKELANEKDGQCAMGMDFQNGADCEMGAQYKIPVDELV
jgi:hypothetical protein